MKENKYLVLYRKLRDEMKNGAYDYGMKIPSKRDLAERESCSMMTVEHALAMLEEEGYIQAKPRSGYYCTYRPASFFDGEAKIARKEFRTPSMEENTFPYTVYARAVRKVLSDHDEILLSRSEPNGAEVLRRAISSYLYRARGIQADPERIIIGAGSEYLYSLIVSMLGTHRIYGIETPSYHRIEEIYKSMGVRIDNLQLGNNGILNSELERTPASVLHVTPYRSFPTGSTADINKKQQYLSWASTTGRFLIEDDYRSEFAPSVYGEETLFAMGHNAPIIYLNTFTRTIGSGVRVGYMILPEGYPELTKSLSFRSCSVSVLTQYVLAELLNNGSFERNLNRLRKLERTSSGK